MIKCSSSTKTILGIESSCDETGCSVGLLKPFGVNILSNIVSSSATLQAKYGGVIPEQAAREQLKVVIPVIEEAIRHADIRIEDIDAIAVTNGPGLIGSLLVGVETAKVLSLIWDKPIIPVNHLSAHFYANWIKRINKDNEDINIDSPLPSFPFIGLLVSGGHSDLLLFKDHNQYIYLGGTRDDAAGECFDKCARILDLPYPGGPQIAKLAVLGNSKVIRFPRPMIGSGDFDFSFSGLKTAVANLVQSPDYKNYNKEDICASVQQAIIDSLIKKAVRAARANSIEQIVLAGGVAANKELVEQLKNISDGQVITPPAFLCTDNAAMVAAAGFFTHSTINPYQLQANPNLTL